jgi:hypothetical protein
MICDVPRSFIAKYSAGVRGLPDAGHGYSAIYTTEVDKKTRMPKEAGAINRGLWKRGGPWLLKTPTVAVVVPDLQKRLRRPKLLAVA